MSNRILIVDARPRGRQIDFASEGEEPRDARMSTVWAKAHQRAQVIGCQATVIKLRRDAGAYRTYVTFGIDLTPERPDLSLARLARLLSVKGPAGAEIQYLPDERMLNIRLFRQIDFLQPLGQQIGRLAADWQKIWRVVG